MLRLLKVWFIDNVHDILIFAHRSFQLIMGPVGVIAIGAVAVLIVTVAFQMSRVPDLKTLNQYHGADSIQIYDSKDKLICNVSLGGSSIAVPLSQIPRGVQLAVLAAEDHRFYQHPGLDLSGITRAMLANFWARRMQQGGSTITQQLVKNLFYGDEQRTIDRKVAEMLVALSVEQHYSKDEILAMYLNEIYFGNGAHGIEQAALKYFGKDVWDLSLAEGAFLAGLIRAPSFYGDPEHRQETFVRQWQVLDAMVEYGYISQRECSFAKSRMLVFKSMNSRVVVHPFNRYPYYVSFVLDFLRQHFTEAEMRREGLHVYTNLDRVAQEAAEQTLAREIVRAPRGVSNEALISMGAKDAAIRAIVGGAHDYWSNQWNSATNPHTVGSLFKPFVYLTGFLTNQINPNSRIDDSPIKIPVENGKIYSPVNFDHRYMGKITVRSALANSRNVCAVRVAQMVGISNVVNTARLAGVTSPLPQNYSLALGSAAISPLELIGAYGTFARGGLYMKPWAIRRIDNRAGHTIASFGPEVKRVFPDEPVFYLVDVLQEVVEHGTGTQAKLAGRPVAGKTGTADKARDIWFVGFTPDMVTAVWGGNDQNLPIAGHNVTGGSVMAQVWRDYNRAYYAKTPQPAGYLMAIKYQGAGTEVNAPAPERHRVRPSVPRVAHVHQTPRRPVRVIQTNPPDTEYYQGAIRRNNNITDYVWAR
jgi:1A family penicillin-binding protein